MKKIAILVVDDQALLREAWVVLLSKNPQFLVVGESPGGKEAVRISEELKPDIVLMDITMGDMDGVLATSQILQCSPLSRILALSLHKQPGVVKKIIQAGASGYVTKDSTAAELDKAILKVYSGGNYICEAVINEFWADASQNKDEKKLTQRERQIVEYVKEGKSSRDISDILKIETGTVNVHRYNVLKKLRLKKSILLADPLNSEQV